MKTKQKGFTLIELVVVIVLLGIIGAVATARFQNMSAVARTAVVQGLAAELSSSAVINFGAVQAGVPAAQTVALTGGTATDCVTGTLQNLLQTQTWPAGGYTAAAGATAVACGGVAGRSFTCIINHPQATQSATATLLCTG